MRRVLQPELLDHLPPTDPRAVRSRTDLRRLNRLMGHARFFARVLLSGWPKKSSIPQPMRLAELGAGDGSLLLQLAQRWSGLGLTGHAILIDRHGLVSKPTRLGFQALGWTVECLVADVFYGLDQMSDSAHLMMANLFLHHFPEPDLRRLLHLASSRADRLVALEPRRSWMVWSAARLVGLLGCNAVTRHDARISVQAGFAGNELSRLWPQEKGWILWEQSAGWFSHGFIAQRNG